jgi:hypothetical protein
MKNLKTFSEFVNESALNEKMISGSIVKQFGDVLGSRDLANVDLEIAKFLGVGSKMADVAQFDEYSGEDSPKADKIYNYLGSNFKATDSKTVDDYELSYDSKLNVVRATDAGDGFVSYYVVATSNF